MKLRSYSIQALCRSTVSVCHFDRFNMRTGLTKHVACFLTLLFFEIAAIGLPLFSQTRPRTVHQGRGNIVDPVVITGFNFNGTSIQRGIAFDGNNDWVKNISVIIKNVSTKKITAIRLYVDFPELADPNLPHGPKAKSVITVGHLPDHFLYADSGEKISITQRQDISLDPEATIEVKLADYANQISDMLHRFSVNPNPTKCSIGFTLAFFEDKTMWSNGGVFYQQSNVHGKYDEISHEQFKGLSNKK